ncbi:hypothetical protein ES319_D12G297800v1 [Gossypium barbadense]|uniref:Uncharacterized protein n=2 Tax=Gossypium TaxID=3633 RepID=A0A5J5P4L2_GOSBA|nr:hypothetical protein ES319_D12G297800v1 [Gossypium barbadense]TYG43138.1 hypothetical protein ES288_D12G313300v1 [Gossypium darwinii]
MRTLSDESRNGTSVCRARSVERGTVWRLPNVGHVALLIVARVSAVLGQLGPVIGFSLAQVLLGLGPDIFGLVHLSLLI